MKIRIAKDRGVAYKGEHLDSNNGEVHEVDDHFGAVLVSQERAVEVEDGEREERAAHRDRAVRSGTRG